MFEFDSSVEVVLQENGDKDVFIKSPSITLIGATSHPADQEVREVMNTFSAVLLECTLPRIRHQRFSRCWERINYPPTGESILCYFSVPWAHPSSLCSRFNPSHWYVYQDNPYLGLTSSPADGEVQISCGVSDDTQYECGFLSDSNSVTQEPDFSGE